jgi:nitrogen regulatory protein PII
MKSEKILSHKLFLQRENAIQHQGYEIELVFYEAVKNGDFEALKKVMQPLQSDKLGILSKNPIRNLKYHLIITIALITRFCIEGGLPHETAYTLSDIYIQQLDVCNDVESIVLLHREVTYDFTNRMKELKALYIIVNAGFASEVVDIARSVGSTGATIINARGSVAKPKTILGITIDTEKEIVLSVVEKDVAIKIMEKVKEKAGVGTAAHGLCFFLPVEMSTLTIHDQPLDEA